MDAPSSSRWAFPIDPTAGALSLQGLTQPHRKAIDLAEGVIRVLPLKARSGATSAPMLAFRAMRPLVGAVANAVFEATGKRLRRAPVNPANIMRSI
jgi:hypothetical protein